MALAQPVGKVSVSPAVHWQQREGDRTCHLVPRLRMRVVMPPLKLWREEGQLYNLNISQCPRVL
jgi:hypothetical protein